MYTVFISQSRNLRRTLGLVVGIMGISAACVPPVTNSLEDDGDATMSGATSSATITVGETVYEFAIDLTGQCNSAGSTISGTFSVDADGNALQGGDASRALSLSFVVPEPDWESRGLEPPQISVDDSAMNVRWQAGGISDLGTVPETDSELVMWQLQGGRAQGAATFIDLTAQLAGQDARVVSGSFDITCGE